MQSKSINDSITGIPISGNGSADANAFAPSSLRKIGNFSFSLGTEFNNNWTDTPTLGKKGAIEAHGFQIALGGRGNDELRSYGNMLTKDGLYRRTSILSGGPGNDTYSLTPAQSVVIVDAGGGAANSGWNYDEIDARFLKYSDIFLAKVEGRDLLVTDKKEFTAILVDPTGKLSPGNIIESIRLSDTRITTSELSYALNSNLIPNYSYSYLADNGYLNLGAVGIKPELIPSYIADLAFNNELIGSAQTSRSSAEQSARFLHEANISNYSFGNSYDIDLSSSNSILYVGASTYNVTLNPQRVVTGGPADEFFEAPQIDFAKKYPAGYFGGSIIFGGDGNDIISGKAGWDLLSGGNGNDLIRGGNGRDIISGGFGKDELHGDFGLNTFLSEQDGYSDLLVIKSDEYVVNWLYGKAGNNSDGSKVDIIEGLDAYDSIKLVGVSTPDISVRSGVYAQGTSGIGIFARGTLEALYTGSNLSVSQITAITSGDGSAAALANQIGSYGWTI